MRCVFKARSSGAPTPRSSASKTGRHDARSAAIAGRVVSSPRHTPAVPAFALSIVGAAGGQAPWRST
jgi:hypothetical protein